MTNEKSRFLAIYGATLLALIVVIVVILSLESATSRAVVDENGLVETASVAVYFFCFLLILFFVKDVRLQTRAVLAFILLCLIAREIGLPALLGMAPVQFAMFRNPGVSLVEKISVVLIFAALAYSIGYLVFTYAIYVVRGSFRLEPVPVGIILGLGLLSVAQLLD